MKVLIAGCGKVGSTIVQQLSEENHTISIIDHNLDVVSYLSNTYDVMGVVGNAASIAIQKEAGVEDADLFIAVTNSDEINLLCCLVAKKAGNCKTIARVRNPIYREEIGFIKEELGLSMAINPEQQAAGEMGRVLRFPEAINIDSFARGRIELTEFIIPEGNILDGMSLADVGKKIQSKLLICIVQRGEEAVIPNGSFVLKSGDKVHFMTDQENGRVFFRTIGIEMQKIKDVMIIGSSRITYYLSKILIGSGMRVKIIEKDRGKCEEISALLPEATVICGDATNQDVLMEEGMSNADAFVALTGMDEANIFLSLSARNVNKTCKLITKLNRLTFDSVIEDFNLGSIFYPKYMTAESIVRYVRAMQNGMGSNVEALYRLVGNKVEALEFIISEDSPVKDIPLSELPIKPDILIAAISRKRNIIYPNGSTRLEEGDRVVIITTIKGLGDIKDILK